MSSEIRVNKLTNRIGLSTVTFADSGIGVTVTGRIDPDTDSARDLGTTSVRWRNVYADTLYGDGSNLTSLPSQVTINNASANRVLTSDGGTTLNGEANLTFNSSLVVTDGNGTVTTGGNYINLKRTSGDTNYINAPLADAELHISADENIIFKTVHTGDFNSTERLRIKSDGDVSINDGNLIVASGHGIDFSATGNLSGTQSELLDDYEEGTWTPEINGGYSSISYHNPRIGYYTKVGNHVSFQIYLYVYQATGAAANVQITLPFTSLSNSGRETGAYTAYSNGFMSSSWNEKSGCGYLIGGNYSYLRPCKLTNGAVIYGNDTRLGTGANNQYLIICGQMFAA